MYFSTTSLLAALSALATTQAAPLDLFHLGHHSNSSSVSNHTLSSTPSHNHTSTSTHLASSSSTHSSHSYSHNTTLPTLAVNYTLPSVSASISSGSAISSAHVTHTASSSHSAAYPSISVPASLKKIISELEAHNSTLIKEIESLLEKHHKATPTAAPTLSPSELSSLANEASSTSITY